MSEKEGEATTEDGRIVGGRINFVTRGFPKRPFTVKDPLMVVCFWELHWLEWKCVARETKWRGTGLDLKGLYLGVAICRHRVIRTILSYLISKLGDR